MCDAPKNILARFLHVLLLYEFGGSLLEVLQLLDAIELRLVPLKRC